MEIFENGGRNLIWIITNETSLEELVSLRLFSWGEVKDNSLRVSLKLGEFLNHTFGGDGIYKNIMIKNESLCKSFCNFFLSNWLWQSPCV